jgi:hypothetical protein
MECDNVVTDASASPELHATDTQEKLFVTPRAFPRRSSDGDSNKILDLGILETTVY